jgi:DUF438 domain-containing protein
VRDNKEDYKGTLKVSQYITNIKKLEGEIKIS